MDLVNSIPKLGQVALVLQHPCCDPKPSRWEAFMDRFWPTKPNERQTILRLLAEEQQKQKDASDPTEAEK